MNFRKLLYLLCAAILLIALIDLPIGYYTFLRIVVTIGAVTALISEIEKGLGFWVFVFGAILILFNPIIPIYLNDKSAWMPIDIITAIFFIIKIFINGSEKDK